MFKKASNIHLEPKRRYKMVASRQLEVPLYAGIGQQRGRGLGALAQVIGEVKIRFWVKVSSQLHLGRCWLMEFAAPNIAGVFSGRKNFKTAAKSVGWLTDSVETFG